MRQKIRRQGGKQPESQRALRRVGAAPGHRPYLLDIVQHQPGPVGDFLAHGGQHDHLGRSLDQLHAQLLLQLLDLGAERGLADETGVGGLAEMPQVGQLDEILQGAQVHRDIILVG